MNIKLNKITIIKLLLAMLAVVIFAIVLRGYLESSKNYPIGDAIMAKIADQLEFGPRYVGADGHSKVVAYISQTLTDSQIQVVNQVWVDSSGKTLNNIIGRINPDSPRRFLLGTHYDSKDRADNDKQDTSLPVPGANDSASGTALLLELAKDIKNDFRFNELGIDVVFFDAEEFEPGPYDNWQAKGSTYFAQNIDSLYPSGKPELAIVPDLVCDKDLRFYKEGLSQKNAQGDVDMMWRIGQMADGKAFSNKINSEIKDDHTALVKVGVPSILLIDLEYPYFHTSQDTLDKCSSKSLETAYSTIKSFLLAKTSAK